MADIAKIAPSNYKLPLKHPSSGEPIGLTIELASIQDDRFKKIERRVTDNVMKKRARGKTLQAEEIETNRLELIASVMLGWEWDESGSFGGEQLKFSPVNVAKILAVDWIRDQIDEALAEPANFFPN